MLEDFAAQGMGGVFVHPRAGLVTSEDFLLSHGINGQAAGETFRQPYVIDCDRALAAGSHEFSIEVRGNLKNLMGPHFNDGLPGPWSWDLSPKTPPLGGDYARHPSALTELPRLREEK